MCEDGYKKITPDPQQGLFDAMGTMEIKELDEFSVLLPDGYPDGQI